MALLIRHVSALADVSPTVPAGMYGLLGPDGARATRRAPDAGAITLGEGPGAFGPAEPDLEDVYFAAMAGLASPPAPAAVA